MAPQAPNGRVWPAVMRGERIAGHDGGVIGVEVFVDPSCPWAWITCQWLREVAPQRELALTWRSYCMEIRDDYDVAPTISPENGETAIAAHAVSHRMLRIFEAARSREGEDAVDALFRAWGPRFFVR